MNKDNYPDSMPRQFVPIRPMGYVGYNLLFAIPLVGFIMLIVFATSDENINRRNYARSFLWAMLISFCISTFIILIVLLISLLAGGLNS